MILSGKAVDTNGRNTTQRLCKTVLQTDGEFQGQIESCKLQDLLNSVVIDIICST